MKKPRTTYPDLALYAPPYVFCSRIDHRNSQYNGCECQQCTPTHAALDIAMGGDGLDSDGYSLDAPREWSEDELTELRRREFATDNYGRDI